MTQAYDAWGDLTYIRETIPNPIRYAGEYQDEETGLYYLRARYYNPKLGRFTQEDPARADGYNWYVYCGNKLIKRKSHTDKKPCPTGILRYSNRI